VDFSGAMTRLVLVIVLFAACDPPSLMVHRPVSPDVDRAVTTLWTKEIRGVARDGDWLLTRSYYALGDAIVIATPGEDLTHASIYDAQHGTVIEAVGSGIREIPLETLIARNHYIMVVRPRQMTPDDQRAALGRARGKLGVAFDKAGMFGFDDPDTFYCSELLYWASDTEARNGERERIVTPSDLLKYGDIVYWSGHRTDSQVMAIATAR
jgi:hypothetical protein